MPPLSFLDAEEILHAADINKVERQILRLACDHTGSHDGAIFSWDPEQEVLKIDFHLVGDVEIPIPGRELRRRTDGRPNGIAFHAADTGLAHLTNDTAQDPHYARYFLDVKSILAVPIPYQDHSIGVISVSSLQTGAYGPEHIEALQQLAAASAKFLRRAQLHRKEKALGHPPMLIKGLSAEWTEVDRLIERVSPTNAPVLVRGESGTGKELVCRAVHFNSLRAGKPFVSINCAAIPEALLESTLFGHAKGAFTGAAFAKVGEFEKADGGTLFLDEIGELSPPLQSKVLRALELGEIQPVGSNEPPRRVDVRLLAATNRDLEAMRAEGTFRDDLFFRLAVVTIRTPPLRSYLANRKNLEVLCQVFVTQANERYGTSVQGMTDSALEALRQLEFPGNVRQLRNLIDRAAIVCDGPLIRATDLPQPSAARAPAAASEEARARPSLAELRRRWVADAERSYLEKLLEETRGNIKATAAICGVDRTTLYRLLKKHAIRLERRVARD